MKKTLLICLIAITAIIGCKKDENKVAASKLIGSWRATIEFSQSYENGTLKYKDTSRYDGADELNLVFTTTEMKIYEDGDLENTSAYTYSDNKLTFTDEDGDKQTLGISFGGDNQFVATDDYTETYNGVVQRFVSATTFVKK
ncbi:MAG: hypothetical protein V4619_09545 [Bacteroidota bacterium]